MVCGRPLLAPRVVSRWMGPTPARASTLTNALPARQPRLRNLGSGGPVCSGVSSPPIPTRPECPGRERPRRLDRSSTGGGRATVRASAGGSNCRRTPAPTPGHEGLATRRGGTERRRAGIRKRRGENPVERVRYRRLDDLRDLAGNRVPSRAGERAVSEVQRSRFAVIADPERRRLCRPGRDLPFPAGVGRGLTR